MKSCLLFLIFFTVTYSLPVDDIYKTEWEKFKLKFNKHYLTHDEENHRFQIFSDNLDKIIEHNKRYEQGEELYQMGVTQFTEWTREEFIEFLREEGGGVPLKCEEIVENNARNYGFSDSNIYETEWEKFKLKFNKHYLTENETNYRFQVFSHNLDIIIEHNKKYERGETLYRMGVTRFADMTREEFIDFLKKQWNRLTSESDEYDASDVYKTEWEKFKLRFNKHYLTDDEENHRFKVFSDNLDIIIEHNKKFENGETFYKKGVTQFTDMTKEEFIEFLKEEGGQRSLRC